MKLKFIGSDSKSSRQVIMCGYGRTFNMDGGYLGYNVDRHPHVLSLGRWVSPRGNNLLAGINLHYLSDEQVARLQAGLSEILGDRNLQRRVRRLRAMMPDVFEAYRTYDIAKISGAVKKGTLKFIGAADFVKRTKQEEKPEGLDGADKPISVPHGLSDKIKQRHERIRGKSTDPYASEEEDSEMHGETPEDQGEKVAEPQEREIDQSETDESEDGTTNDGTQEDEENRN